jgi:hypothetical protein
MTRSRFTKVQIIGILKEQEAGVLVADRAANSPKAKVAILQGTVRWRWLGRHTKRGALRRRSLPHIDRRH